MTDIALPEIDVTLPAVSVDWAYEKYAGMMLNLIEAAIIGHEDELSSFWGAFESQQASVWSPSFDLLTTMGYRNPMAVAFGKELRYQRSLYQDQRDVLAEAIRLKNLELYVKTRLDIEKERRGQYVAENQLEATFLKDIILLQTEADAAVTKEYELYVSKAKAQVEFIRQVIAKNAATIKLMQAAIDQVRAVTEQSRAELALKKAELAVAEAQLAAAEAEVRAQEAELRAEGIKIEVQRLTTETLIEGTKLIAELARRQDFEADIRIIDAQIDEIRAANAELESIREQAHILKTFAETKKGAFDALLKKKQAIATKMIGAQKDELSKEGEFITKQVEAAEKEIEVQYAEGEARLNDIGSRGDAEEVLLGAETAADLLNAQRTAGVKSNRLDVMNAEFTAMVSEENQRAMVADKLAKAHIINRFTEHR